MRTMVLRLGAAALVGVALVPAAWAQAPQATSFTYQGQLTEAGALASGPYDFQFVLYDAPVDGNQVGPTVTLDDLVVTVGLFTVSLDFGSVFGSERRWLELGVRPGADNGPYTPILPRQEVTPGPSALFSAAAGDSLQLGGVPAGQFVQTDDPRLTDARDPLPGSPDYVQNGSVAQPGVGFNVGGTGAANILDAATQYNLGGARILGNPGTHNLFVGVNAGAINSSGTNNSFFGHSAGQANTTGGANAFFGNQAGFSNTDSSGNSFFGSRAGRANLTGGGNSFFGSQTGEVNTTGAYNSFFGTGAGSFNTDGSDNAIFGTAAGTNNNGSFNAYYGAVAGFTVTTGNRNTFLGGFAGMQVSNGSDNTFVGYSAGVTDIDTAASNNTLLGANTKVFPNLSNATALGASAQVFQSNSLILGGIQGVNGGTDTNVGIGTGAPSARLHVRDGGNILFGGSSGCPNVVGIAFSSSISANCQNYSIYGGDGSTHINRPLGASIFFREANVTQVSIKPGGVLNLQALGFAGLTPLCRNVINDISTCSSSLRYKTDVAPFRGGLELVERLRPIRFTWKANGKQDIGLAAEEVAEVDPLLAFRNALGEIEGVNYSQLTVVLVNALKQQQKEIDALKALVCEVNPQAGPCLRRAQQPE